jgi:Spy/CpxP family protein refolding chaperone
MRHGGASRQQWWRMGLALAVIGLWSAVGWAQPGREHGAWADEAPLPALLKAAGVTDEQKAQIKAIVADHRPALRSLYGQLRAANQTLTDGLFIAGDPTLSVEKITQIRGQLLVETVKMRQEVLAVLTPDQLAKVAQLKDQLRGLQAERHNLLMGEMPSVQ